jgi:hypothetical protein
MKLNLLHCGAIAGTAAFLLASCASMGGAPTTFFITSTNPGKGGDLGGLAGADAQCEKLAAAAGIGGRNWRAYLSTQATGGAPAVNARDRIGNGPWYNAKGLLIATNVAELHGSNNPINKATGLTETGEAVPATGDPVNKHDILTGSLPDGTAMPTGRDATCGNWTSSDQGSAMVGHHNRTGINPDPVANVSWNSSHGTPGCSLPALARVGGAGLMYCFAAK